MSFGFYLDIILLCLIALIMYLSVKRGFVRLTLSGLSLLLAMVIAFGLTALLVRPVARALTPGVQKFIVHQSARILPDEKALDTVASVSEKVVTVFRALLKKVSSTASEAVAAEVDPLYELSYGIACGFYGFILLAVLFALSYAGLKVLITRLDFVKTFPVLGVMDSTLSVITGIVVSLIVLYIPAIFLYSILPAFLGEGFSVSDTVLNGSLLLRLTSALYPFD